MRTVLIVAAAVMSGCSNDVDRVIRERADVKTNAIKQSIDNCLKAGGMVVFSHWDGEPRDCVRVK